ncbi:D-hexose-6-phosphate mutarotase [Guyparkeria sp. 1SP6A2]|nr:D-hexose-6-phosphate mutarotase [Guyparkeria sp. 1SP6A2]
MIEQMQERFAQPGVRVYRHGELAMLELSNVHGSVTITPLGATVLSYVPAGGEETIWVSETAVYDGSKPVRGGIPVCWPWFGAHPDDPTKKAHGFARHAQWELVSVHQSGGTTEATFCLDSSDATRAIWPGDFHLELNVTLDTRLSISLTAENRGDEDWNISEALHSYFRVRDARGMLIEGLEGLRYMDKVHAGARDLQDEPLRVTPPVDRVFFDHTGAAALHDADRRILVDKLGSHSTVVWNPGAEGAKELADMPDAAWPEMVCLEAANALDNAYILKAGHSHTLTMVIGAQPARSSD